MHLQASEWLQGSYLLACQGRKVWMELGCVGWLPTFLCAKPFMERTRIEKREVRGFHVYSGPKNVLAEDQEVEVILMVIHLKENSILCWLVYLSWLSTLPSTKPPQV